jgi:hypothetical protein
VNSIDAASSSTMGGAGLIGVRRLGGEVVTAPTVYQAASDDRRTSTGLFQYRRGFARERSGSLGARTVGRQPCSDERLEGGAPFSPSVISLGIGIESITRNEVKSLGAMASFPGTAVLIDDPSGRDVRPVVMSGRFEDIGAGRGEGRRGRRGRRFVWAFGRCRRCDPGVARLRRPRIGARRETADEHAERTDPGKPPHHSPRPPTRHRLCRAVSASAQAPP